MADQVQEVGLDDDDHSATNPLMSSIGAGGTSPSQEIAAPEQFTGGEQALNDAQQDDPVSGIADELDGTLKVEEGIGSTENGGYNGRRDH